MLRRSFLLGVTILLSITTQAGASEKVVVDKLTLGPGASKQLTINVDDTIQLGWSRDLTLNDDDTCPNNLCGKMTAQCGVPEELADFAATMGVEDDPTILSGLVGGSVACDPIDGRINLKMENLAEVTLSFEVSYEEPRY